jgi:hypothetical protein
MDRMDRDEYPTTAELIREIDRADVRRLLERHRAREARPPERQEDSGPARGAEVA